MRTRLRSSFAGAALTLFSACYTQQPLTASRPEPATRIVALLTDTGRVELANRIGPGATEVEGIVSAADEASWDVQVIRVAYIGGTSVLWNRETVRFPRYALTGTTVKRLDRGRSWAAAGLIAVGAVALVKVFGPAGGDDPLTEPPPIPPAVLVP